MTTPDGETTKSFGGILVPIDVQNRILSLLVGGAPFANSLSQLPTNRSQVGFPTASPTGFSWLSELDEFPEITMADAPYVVAVAKIGGIIDLSNELVDDASVNVTTTFSSVLSDGLSRDLDLGLLNGSGVPPQPQGVIAAAANVDATDLLSGVSQAVGEIADAGGSADTVAMSGTAMAAANSTTTDIGGLVYPGGFAPALGLKPVTVPDLSTVLVYDSTRIWCVVNRALSSVDISRDYHFSKDATSYRVKARVAVADPTPAKSIRKVTVATAPPLGRSSAKASK